MNPPILMVPGERGPDPRIVIGLWPQSEDVGQQDEKLCAPRFAHLRIRSAPAQYPITGGRRSQDANRCSPESQGPR